MIKGVNKNIIEVSDTGSRYFEKVILFVKPEYSDSNPELLKSQAKSFVNNVGTPHTCTRPFQQRRIKKRKFKVKLYLYLSTLVVIAFLIILTSKYL